MAQDPQKINVVVSGASSTQVVSPGSNTINLNQQSSTVNVQTSSSTSNITTTPGATVANIGFLGVQGPAGNVSEFTSPAGTPDNSIFFNNDGKLSGINGFFYYPNSDNLKISGKNLILDNDSTFSLSGTSSANAFLLKDATDNILRIDSENNRMLLAESNGYKIGVGNTNPQEKIHISNGNLRLDGNMLISGNILPLKSGEFNLGSPSFPFKDLYLQGNSIVFVDKEAKITASKTGFSFQVTNAQGQSTTLAEIKTENVGVFKGDGSGITGVPYSGLIGAGAFLSVDVPHLSDNVTVNYGKTLDYDPIVICSQTESNNGNTYHTTVDNITRSSCRATFSDKVSGQGFSVNCHISPRNPSF